MASAAHTPTSGLRGVRLAVAALLLSSTMLAGCENASETAQGAGIGAAVGGILGAVLGGRDGALIGLAAGAALGAGTGALIQNKKESFASAEQELEVRTERAQTAAATQQQRAQAANQVAAAYTRQLAPLRQEVSSGQQFSQAQQISLQQAKKERDGMKKQLKEGRDAVNALQSQIADLQKKGQNTAQLDRERQNIESSNRNLEGSLDTMQNALSGVEV